jgi:hypothetical protein
MQHMILMQSDAHEYTMFTTAQLLHNWHEQWPTNYSDQDLNVTVEHGRVIAWE